MNPSTQASLIWESMKKDAENHSGGDVMVGTAPRTKMEKQVLRDLCEHALTTPSWAILKDFEYFAEGLGKKF